jgi:hypothetical protein
MQNIWKLSLKTLKHECALLKLEKKEKPSETANDPLLVLVSVCWPASG